MFLTSNLLQSSRRVVVNLKSVPYFRGPSSQARHFSTAAPATDLSSSSTTSTPSGGGGNNVAPGQSLQITDSCKKRLSQILDDRSFLRVSVEGGGCSGFQYKFQIDSERGSDDIVIHGDGSGDGSRALIVTDEVSLDLIKGSTLDYETELIRSTFRVINNPLAEQGCSCGASFNMKL